MGDLGQRFVDCFALALDDAGLPADPAFREARCAYLRWATSEVLSYTPEDAEVPHDVPMPRWSLNGLA